MRLSSTVVVTSNLTSHIPHQQLYHVARKGTKKLGTWPRLVVQGTFAEPRRLNIHELFNLRPPDKENDAALTLTAEKVRAFVTVLIPDR
jgi:hypothetical protein